MEVNVVHSAKHTNPKCYYRPFPDQRNVEKPVLSAWRV